MKIFSPVEIKKLVYGGYGLGWSEGKTLFVERVLPGEVVTAQQTGKTGKVIITAPVEIITPSPDRREPSCPDYTSCGGCGWLHITYPIQVREKEHILMECLQRIGKIEHIPGIKTFSSPEWEYRIRVQFKVDHKGKRIGFFRHNSHDVVDISHCPLLDPAINGLLREKETLIASLVPGEVASKGAAMEASVRKGCTTGFRAGTEVKVIAGINGNIASSPVIDPLTTSSTTICINSINFVVRGNSFFQGNKFLHHSLGTWPGECVTEPYCIDLYGGTGFFSCLSGGRFQQGILVEGDKGQAGLANENFKANNMGHFKAVAAPVESITRGLFPFPMEKTAVIVDPPRTGLSKKLVHILLGLQPGRIIYVSCNPSTQARDIHLLVSKGTYKLTSIALFDMYPHTYHIESGIILEKM